MNFYSKTIVFFLFSFLISVSSLHAESYYNNKSNIHFEIPQNWELVETNNWRKIALSHSDNIATINISVFVFPKFEIIDGIEEKSVTINGFQKRRVTSFYDGWINLFERPGTEYESTVANVSENYVAVYSKNALNDQLQLTKEIIGEYYFLKRNIGYIITIQTHQNYWQDIQGDAKKVVESFWVGTGVRPQLLSKNHQQLGWIMPGGDVTNQNQVPGNINLSKLFKSRWEQQVHQDPDEALQVSEPVMTKEDFFLIINQTLYSLNISSGNMRWMFDLEENQTSVPDLLFHQDILYLVTHKNDKKVLKAIMTQNGSELFNNHFETTNISNPVYHHNVLYMVQEDALLALNPITGETLWHKSLNLNSEFAPLVYDDQIIVIDQRNRLLITSANNGKILQKYSIQGDILQRPMISGQQLFVSYEGKKANTILALNLETNKPEWETKINTESFATESASNSEHILVIVPLEQDELINSYNMIALSKETGENIWESPFATSRETILNRPIVYDNAVLLNGGTAVHSGVFAIDNITGEKITEPLTQSSTGTRFQLLGSFSRHLYSLKLTSNKLSIIAKH